MNIWWEIMEPFEKGKRDHLRWQIWEHSLLTHIMPTVYRLTFAKDVQIPDAFICHSKAIKCVRRVADPDADLYMQIECLRIQFHCATMRIATVAKWKSSKRSMGNWTFAPSPQEGISPTCVPIYWQLPKTLRIDLRLQMAECDLPPTPHRGQLARSHLHAFQTHWRFDYCLLIFNLFLIFYALPRSLSHMSANFSSFFSSGQLSVFCDWAISLRFPEVQLLRTLRVTDFRLHYQSVIHHFDGFLHVCNVSLLLLLFACQAYSAEK